MWRFVSPQIVFGEGALDYLTELEGRRAFIVTDARLVELGIVEQVKRRLENAGMTCQVFDAVEPEPSLRTVRKGAAEAAAFEPDWIVGVGGGSPMDAAKAIWVLYECPDLDPAEINPFVTLGLRRKARLLTVPTTSGTGAEVTWGIVLTDTDEERKMGLGNYENVADVAIVDPALAAGMPPELTADTGLDALTHAVEGYTCAWHNDISDGLCKQAIRLIFDYLPRAVADGSDAEARERVHNAATIAGLGFGNAMASMAHALGHVLGATFHVPHGCAVALYLPYTVEFIAAETPERFAHLACEVGAAAPDGDPELAARALAERLRELYRQLGRPTRVADLDVAREAYEEQIEKLVEDAFNDTQMITATRTPSFDELAQLYRYAYEGKRVDF